MINITKEEILDVIGAEWQTITILENGEAIEVQAIIQCRLQLASQPNREVHPSIQD